MKCTVDGVEYERVESNIYTGCDGCVADGMSPTFIEFCQRLETCIGGVGIGGVGKNYIWIKVEHVSNS